VDESILEYVNDYFDSNVITPGTEFMDDLSNMIRYYVLDRMNKHPHWKNLKVFKT
jgi:5'-3' exonuclease